MKEFKMSRLLTVVAMVSVSLLLSSGPTLGAEAPERLGAVKTCKETYWETIKAKNMTCRRANDLLDRGETKLNETGTRSTRVGKHYRCRLPYFPYWDSMVCAHVDRPKKKWAKYFGE